MDTNQLIRAVKTPVTLVLLAALVAVAAWWGWDVVTKPVPPRPPDPCVVKQVGPELTPEHVYVRVYNGSQTNGLSKRVGALLSADGFKVVKRVNADRKDYQRSVVVGYAENSPEVVLVRTALTNVDFRADGRIDHTVDVIIGVQQPGSAQAANLKVALPEGTACLPQLNSSDVNE